MTKLPTAKMACVIFAFCLAAPTAAPAQTFTTLASFDGTNGGGPKGSLVQGFDGNLHGTSQQGGVDPDGYGCFNGCGTLYNVSFEGTLTSLYDFGETAALQPWDLVQAPNGNFYGTTGNFNFPCGNFFEVTPEGTLTLLHTFGGADGCGPGGLILATDGNYYGTAAGGAHGGGTVFKITPAGELTTIYSFCSQLGCADGDGPGSLLQATDGNFYGTAGNAGGPNGSGWGTIFKLTPGGTLTTLHSFQDGSDGYFPGGLMQAADGNFYGTTLDTFFKITPGGKLTTIYTGGCLPGGAVLATDGNFYGITGCGANSYGTVVKMTPGGALTTLHSFDGTDGCFVDGSLVQATNGNFYGTTLDCGSSGEGTVFSLSVGLGPFVSFLRSSGKVGQTEGILGEGFTAATAVSFNGVAATFTAESDTYLTATVPAGATTGSITVSEPGGTLTSNKIFRVLPQISSFSPTDGPAGTTVVITGNSLLGATEVFFACGKKATFTVDSDTQITATVPAGAMTGEISVVTPGGNTGSPTVFTVTP